MNKLEKLMYMDKDKFVIFTKLFVDNSQIGEVRKSYDIKNSINDFELVDFLLFEMNVSKVLGNYDREAFGSTKEVMNFLLDGNHIEIVSMKKNSSVNFINYKNLKDSFSLAYKTNKIGDFLINAVESAGHKLRNNRAKEFEQ